MTALGLAQLCLAHPEEHARLAPEVTRAARKSFLVEMRGFGTRAWDGEDAMASLDGPHGHAYLAYAALAIGMARVLDPAFPPDVARQHDALIAAYERRLLESATGLIETYPGEAYPTDNAAVAAAIAVHGRATQTDHARVLAHWAEQVLKVQLDPASHYVFQRMGARDGRAHDAPRGSGTALAAYFAGFADRGVAETLADGLFRHESTFWGFGAIREYADGYSGWGDVDSGPVLLGVSVSATGFALAPARERIAIEARSSVSTGRRSSSERRSSPTASGASSRAGRSATRSCSRCSPRDRSSPPHEARALAPGYALPVGIHLLLECAVSPTRHADRRAPHAAEGKPDPAIIAAGAAYLAVRLFVHLVLPAITVWTLLARARLWPRWARRIDIRSRG